MTASEVEDVAEGAVGDLFAEDPRGIPNDDSELRRGIEVNTVGPDSPADQNLELGQSLEAASTEVIITGDQSDTARGDRCKLVGLEPLPDESGHHQLVAGRLESIAVAMKLRLHLQACDRDLGRHQTVALPA